MIGRLNIQSNIIPELFASILSIFLALIIFISRLGFENDILLIIKSVFLLFLLIFFPYFINLFFYNKIPKYFLSKPFLNFLSLVLIIFLSEISFIFNIDFSYFLFFFGILFALFLVKYFFKILFSYDIFFLIFIFIFSVWCISAYSSNRYIHPLMIEKIITGAWAHRDFLWHASLAGMLKTYGIIALGIDGLVHYNYHSFSNYFIGKLSVILNTNTLNFYSLIFPIIILPLFFLNFIFAVDQFAIYFKKKFNFSNNIYSNYLFWITLLCLFALAMPYNWFASEKYQYLYSTSYCFAFLFTFIFLANIGYLINIKFNNYKINLDIVIAIFVLSLLFYIISISKFSFLYFIGISYAFFYFRLQLFRKLLFNILVLSAALISLYIYFTIIIKLQIESPQHGFEANLFSEFKTTSKKYYMYLYGTFILLFFKILYLKIYNLKQLYINIINFNLLELEYLFWLSIFLLVFPWQYTNGIQVLISYLFILSQIGLLKQMKNN